MYKFLSLFFITIPLIAWGVPQTKNPPSSTFKSTVEYDNESKPLDFASELYIHMKIAEKCQLLGKSKPGVIMVHNPGPSNEFFILWNCRK